MSYWRCAAPNCKTTHGQGKIFRAFPKGNNLATLWLQSLPTDFELHFELSEFEAPRQDGKKKLKSSAVPTLFVAAPSKPRKALGDLTNFSSESLTVQFQSSTPIKSNKNRSKSRSHVLRDHTYCKCPWDWNESSGLENLDVSFLDACHSALSVSHELNMKTLSLPDAVCDMSDIAKETLTSSCSETLIECTSPEYINDKVQNPPHDSAEIDKERGDLFPIAELFVKDEQYHSQITQPTFTLEDALKLIDKQKADIAALEQDSMKKSEDLKEAYAVSKTLAQNLNVTSEDRQFIALDIVTKNNVVSLIAKQTAEISRLKKHDHLREAQVLALKKSVQSNLGLRKKYLALQKGNARLEMKLKRKTFSRWLTPGQQMILLRNSTRGLKWEPDIIRRGLIRKMACGTAGYEDFRKDCPFFPSARALQDSVKFVKFESGLLEQMFDLLEAYATNCPDFERDCQVVVDEMAITPGQHYDPSTKRIVGKSTFPTHSGLASKGLVFMLAWIAKRWKVTVAVYFTSERGPEFKTKRGHHDDENLTGKAFLDILLQVICRAEKINLLVCGVTSDMGPDNQALWKAAHIYAGRKEDSVVCSIPHPARSGYLVIIPDIVHVFKAVKNGMETNGTIILNEDIVKEENLPTAVIDYQHVQDLYEFEENNELKVAFRLKPDKIKVSNHYLKMRTSTAASVINHRVGVGLNLMAEEKSDNSYSTTAWFIIILNTFFEVMTGRHRNLSLCPAKKTMYDEAIKLIKKVDRVFRTMKVGSREEWKPFQKGIRLLCAGILRLQEYFFTERHYFYLLLGRFSQDCLENLFSMIRLRQPVPHALCFLQCLKEITLAQYAMAIKNTNYAWEESEEIKEVHDFLDAARQRAQRRANERFFYSIMELVDHPVPKISSDELKNYLPEWEQHIVYDMAGSVIASIIRSKYKTCKECVTATQLGPKEDHPRSIVVDSKEYTLLRRKGPGLNRLQVYVTDQVYQAILKCEISFRKMRHHTLNFQTGDVHKYFVENLMYVWDGSEIPSCHKIGRRILEFFFLGRLKEFLRSGREAVADQHKMKGINRSSKTAGMHDAADRVQAITSKYFPDLYYLSLLCMGRPSDL